MKIKESLVVLNDVPEIATNEHQTAIALSACHLYGMKMKRQLWAIGAGWGKTRVAFAIAFCVQKMAKGKVKNLHIYFSNEKMRTRERDLYTTYGPSTGLNV